MNQGTVVRVKVGHFHFAVAGLGEFLGLQQGNADGGRGAETRQPTAIDEVSHTGGKGKAMPVDVHKLNLKRARLQVHSSRRKPGPRDLNGIAKLGYRTNLEGAFAHNQPATG
jgi:hypothetical protein